MTVPRWKARLTRRCARRRPPSLALRRPGARHDRAPALLRLSAEDATVIRSMFLGGPLSRRLAIALWMLRALWVLMLVSPLALYGCATRLTDEFNDAIANGATWIGWVDEPPWSMWLLAATVALGSMFIPPAIERRSIARLRARIGRAVDTRRPGSYRSSPGLISEYPDVVLEAACARYASRLALSFAMLGAVVLLPVWGFSDPAWASGLGFSCRYW